MHKEACIALVVICLGLSGYIYNNHQSTSYKSQLELEMKIKQHFDNTISSYQNKLYERYSDLHNEYQLLDRRVKQLERSMY